MSNHCSEGNLWYNKLDKVCPPLLFRPTKCFDTIIYSVLLHKYIINIASSVLQEDVNRISKWFQDNKLTVNVQKTFLTPFASPHRIKSIKSYPLICANNSKLEWKFECKYLGVILDSCLTWKPHIEYMCNKLRPKIGLLSRLRHILPCKELCMIYMTLIQSIIDFEITFGDLVVRQTLLRLLVSKNVVQD